MTIKCPVCNTEAEREDNRQYCLFYDISCPMCGNYMISHIPLLDNTSQYEKALISHIIRKSHENSNKLRLDPDNINKFLENEKLPNPSEQADNMILWMGKKTKAGEKIQIKQVPLQAIIGSEEGRGFSFIIKHLENEKLLEVRIFGQGVQEAILSFKGWRRYEILKRGVADSRKAFMAMKYDVPELEHVFKNCFKPAVEQTGFDLMRLDEEPKAGLIDDRLKVEILKSKFLVCDLTNDNLGAYWEAGYAAGLGKPVIYTCEEKHFKDAHFDTNHYQAILWNENELEKAAKNLKATIRVTFPADAILEDKPEPSIPS